jgi:hypothetical protein
MTAWYCLPQTQDSVYVPRLSDTTVSQDLRQQFIPSDANETNDKLFLEQTFSLIRQQAATIPTLPEIQTGTLLLGTNSNAENYTGWNTNRNFFVENGLSGVVSELNRHISPGSSPVFNTALKPSGITPHQRNLNTYDWFLGFFLLVTLLFIWIRIFYSKFFATLANALISFQISAKMFREKNVLLHRVSIVLDFIYILVITIFVFELAMHFDLVHTAMSRFNLFLLFLNVFIFYTLLRLLVLRLTGYLFLVQSLFSEYTHNNFVINKGVGIALFPVVIMAHYFPQSLMSPVLIVGMVLFAVAFILKSIRAYQIIIRKDVLIFYLILYLCTLEILPLLLGYKVITSLI